MDNSVRLFVKRLIEKIISRGKYPKRVLEIAPSRKPDRSLLLLDCFQDSIKEGISTVGPFKLGTAYVHYGNSNNMHMFQDESFDMVLSNAVLEHDRYFWRSIEEYKRVLSGGGILIIGVPGFVATDDNKKFAPVFKYHMKEDYYRFSPLAVSQVFLEGMSSVEVYPILNPPRIIGVATKV